MGKLLSFGLLMMTACGQTATKSATAPRDEVEPITEQRFEAKSEVPSHSDVVPLLMKSELSLSIPDGHCPQDINLGALTSDSAKTAEQQTTTCEVSIGGFVCTSQFTRNTGVEFFVAVSYRLSPDRKEITELIDCKAAG